MVSKPLLPYLGDSSLTCSPLGLSGSQGTILSQAQWGKQKVTGAKVEEEKSTGDPVSLGTLTDGVCLHTQPRLHLADIIFGETEMLNFGYQFSS